MNAKVVKLRQPSRGYIQHDEISPITAGVPIPPVDHSSQTRYPIALLKVGESFTVPADRAKSVRSVVSRVQLTNKKLEFVTRVEGDRLRIWRTK